MAAPEVREGSEGAQDLEEPASKEELRRLCELLTEQQRHMTQLLQQQVESEVSDQAEGLLGLIFNNQEETALDMVKGLRPDALLNMADPTEMTALHWAARVGSLRLVFALLEKAPDLAARPTQIGRNPPHWTPLMILAEQPLAANPHHHHMAAALCSHMSVTALMTRAGTLGTVSHLAAGRGNLHVLKKVLWRINDCGGKQAVMSHLSIANSTVSRQH